MYDICYAMLITIAICMCLCFVGIGVVSLWRCLVIVFGTSVAVAVFAISIAALIFVKSYNIVKHGTSDES